METTVKENIATVTHIARPTDSRCMWWQAELKDLSLKDLTERKDLTYYGMGQDLELVEGTFLIDSEENHYWEDWGSTVTLGVVVDGKVIWVRPTIEIKKLIKLEGHQDLMIGSGDVVGCIRIALYLLRQVNISDSLEKIRNATGGK